jgi:hypothetical protein
MLWLLPLVSRAALIFPVQHFLFRAQSHALRECPAGSGACVQLRARFHSVFAWFGSSCWWPWLRPILARPFFVATGSSLILAIILQFRSCCVLDYCRWESVLFLSYRIKKARVFLVLIDFTRWFSEHECNVFDEMPMRSWTDLQSDSCRRSLTRVLTNIDSCFRYDSRVPNQVLRASSLSIAT